MQVTGTWIVVITLGLLSGLVQAATAAQISTAMGNGADIEVREHNNDSNGTREYISSRWNALDRNQVVGLRFDLTGYDQSTLRNASVNFVNFRTNATRFVDIYAVNPGETGGTGSFDTETWTEGNISTWGDFPGLLVTDFDFTTLSIDTNKLTLLVDDFESTNLLKGTVESASSPALADYLRQLPGSTVTLLVTQGGPLPDSGQFRFASRKAFALENDDPVGSVGDFAPFLDIDARPIVFSTNRISTAAGVGADLEVREQDEPGGARDGDSSDLNTRWNINAQDVTNRNDVVGLRFDLSGQDLGAIESVSLNVINYRNNSTRIVDIYAVTPGATGGSGLYTTETWDESNVTDWGDLPGLLVSDGGDCSTQSIDTDNLTLLVDDFVVTTLDEGTVVTMTSSELTTYLRQQTNSTLTLLMTQGGGGSGGQFRFASKDAASLTSQVGVMGQFAPYLEFLAPAPVLNIEGVARAAGPSIVIAWGPEPDHTYGVERTADSLTASNWVAVVSNLAGTVNTYTDTAPVEVQTSYRVIDEGEVPPTDFLFEDFETDPSGTWTVVNNNPTVTNTVWEWGTPTNYPGSAGGPPSGAQGGIGAYGTNLEADYGPLADISLFSPAVNLTGVASATLSFGQYFDMEEFPMSDSGSVFIRDQNGDPITGLENAIASFNNFISDWRTDSYPLPAEALNRIIQIEFQFVSDGSSQFSGWYIDNVRVSD